MQSCDVDSVSLHDCLEVVRCHEDDRYEVQKQTHRRSALVLSVTANGTCSQTSKMQKQTHRATSSRDSKVRKQSHFGSPVIENAKTNPLVDSLVISMV
jgi:hypothetical protein